MCAYLCLLRSIRAGAANHNKVSTMTEDAKDMLRFMIRRELNENIPHNNDVNLLSGIKRAENSLTDLFARLMD